MHIKINEVESPMVGKKYLVPCVYHEKDWPFLGGRFVPVIISNIHEDSELGVYRHHLHYDLRFVAGHKLTQNSVRKVFAVADEFRRINVEYKVEYKTPKTFADLEDLGLIAWRIRTCFRNYQPFSSNDHDLINMVSKLEKLNGNKKACNYICPHRQMSFKGYLENSQGHITCPGHGLTWDKQTGELVKKQGVFNACKSN
ncbi:MAG TPA: Rieske 2Fe-2S domain-containing protein [Nostocaceae cyanobacterium]|nr:Rieske 2Fe-2S domain-containing protein [Nostocaceae cyanobacterium]